MTLSADLGVVVIGRNEGARLQSCLRSVKDLPLVYVDSGSTDNSPAFARDYGATVVELDLTVPFTAARARNSGFKALIESHPDIHFVMFVDGDCEIESAWFSEAYEALVSRSELSVVCGRRRERYPEASMYNLMCDIEWNTPVGEALACGGDAMYRVDVFKGVGGFDDTFIAGEEPELCFRIRAQGGKVWRLDADMTLHDANITRLSQWWRRAQRSGYAYFLNATKHGRSTSEKFKQKEVRGICVWGGGIGAAVVLSALVLSPIPLCIYVALFSVNILRVAKGSGRIAAAYGRPAALMYSTSVMVAKFPQLMGVLGAFVKNMRGTRHTLIEYK